MSLFLILLGGDLVATPRLHRQIAGARVIAADSGIRHAETLGVIPELWLGDFDSVPDGFAERFADVTRKEYPPEKDKTDGELAVEEALGLGATRLVLAGAFGGERADHAFLHLSAALRLAEAGHAVTLSGGTQEGAPILPGTQEFDLPDGSLFSVIAFSDLSGLSIAGAKWPLRDVRVPFGSSLTLSNEVAGVLQVTLGEGRALMIAHPQPDGRA